MKRLLQITLLLTIPSIVIAQTWAPIGAKWTFGLGYAWSNNVSYNEWISTKDTLVGGQNCKLIKRNGNLADGDISDKLITYEDSNIVYWYNTLINQFTTLYDFNKNTGESWTIQLDTSCSLIITVDSTDIETINGYPLKVLYILSQDDAFYGKTVQHIGNIAMPNPYILFHCYSIISDATYYTGLRCYEDNVFGFHDFNIATACDYLYTGLTEQQESNSVFNIYPNPTTDHVHIDNLSGQNIIDISLYSLSSQYVMNFKISKHDLLDLSSVPLGVYFFKIRTDKTVINKMIIKND